MADMTETLRKLGLAAARGVPQLATGFVDLAALPFTMTGVMKPEQAVGSTAYLTSKGLLPPEQKGLLSETTELVSSAMNPAAATKAALAKGGLLAAPMLSIGKKQTTGVLPEAMESYRGSHTAPSPEFGAPLYDLTGGGQMYPADVYSSKAVQYYGSGFDRADRQAFALANSVKGNPEAVVTMYRAVPKESSNSEKLVDLEKKMAAYMKRKTLPKDSFTDNGNKWYDWAYEERNRLRGLPDEPVKSITTINAGDWVTLTKDYAKEHGESALKGNYKIISKKVKAKDLWTNADSIQEFGYYPSK
jgi:hypothetical protein